MKSILAGAGILTGLVVIAWALGLLIPAPASTPTVCNEWYCSNEATEHPETEAPAQAPEAQSNVEGDVTVTVTPLQNSDGFSFEVVLETHSVELNEEMDQVSRLIDNSGKEYLPTSWEGDKPGGHHRQGILRFPAFSADSVILKMTVGGVERIFNWKLD